MNKSRTALLTRAYQKMSLSRALDDYCEGLLRRNIAVPHFHAGTGQEAVSVGAVVPLRPGDDLIYTHRGYGSLLAKGIPIDTVLRDMFMKVGGSNEGFGGVMHVTDPDFGVHGREGVFGTRFPLAVGLAMAAKRQGRDSVALCLYGEAAGARGPLYEALNMAVLWNLPVVLVAENNGWSFSSRTEWLYPQGRITRVWRGFDIPVTEVDGNDAAAVIDTVATAVERARAGGGPAVVEAMTYRVAPHIWYDDETYRTREEVHEWHQNDPLIRARNVLVELGVGELELTAVEAGVRQELEVAILDVATAPAATWPGSEETPRPYLSPMLGFEMETKE